MLLAPNGFSSCRHSLWHLTNALGLPEGCFRFSLHTPRTQPFTPSYPVSPAAAKPPRAKRGRKVTRGIASCSWKREPPRGKPVASNSQNHKISFFTRLALKTVWCERPKKVAPSVRAGASRVTKWHIYLGKLTSAARLIACDKPLLRPPRSFGVTEMTSPFPGKDPFLEHGEIRTRSADVGERVVTAIEVLSLSNVLAHRSDGGRWRSLVWTRGELGGGGEFGHCPPST